MEGESLGTSHGRGLSCGTSHGWDESPIDAHGRKKLAIISHCRDVLHILRLQRIICFPIHAHHVVEPFMYLPLIFLLMDSFHM